MFAIDCIKANGTHLGTCIDRFYFGSCCQLKVTAHLLCFRFYAVVFCYLCDTLHSNKPDLCNEYNNVAFIPLLG